MVSITSLVKKLRSDFPQFNFKSAEESSWSYSEKTIYYTNDQALLLHELAHAMLSHSDYKRDVELINMEQAAWSQAKSLAAQYQITIDEDLIQTNLDSYRDWLHARSQCTKCQANGLQIAKNQYKCLSCNNFWQVNEAKTCALRRYDLPKN